MKRANAQRNICSDCFHMIQRNQLVCGRCRPCRIIALRAKVKK